MGDGMVNLQDRYELAQLRLEDRYELTEGRVFLTGVQALIRLILDQHRADLRAGLHTATLVSGYQGSPLAGLDREIGRLGSLAAQHELILQPAVNEELAATAVWGSQLAGSLPGPRYDGVLGVWYGKAPGVDRASDAIRHGNFVGTDPRGGVLALCGDDPSCKSSTLPNASESLLMALHVPVFSPGSVQEVLDFGRHAIACSRASGLWAALKVVTNVADASATADVGLDRVMPLMPTLDYDGRPYLHNPSAHLLAPQSLEMERSMVEARLELAKRYGQLNRLSRVVIDGPAPRLGVVAAGTTAQDVKRALADIGLGDGGPVRVLSVGMLYPFDDAAVREFAAGLDEILVLEEKTPFLEPMVRDALYGGPATPPVLGKRDDRGHPLVPAYGTLDVDGVVRILAARLDAHGIECAAAPARVRTLDLIAARPVAPLDAVRKPFFCSGCPHNGSTQAPDDAIVGAGIGCHTMVLLSPEHHGRIGGITQMGGEGAQWIGVAPFVDVPHFLQNLGDGTFNHSGSLAIRAAVAANLNVTYKLLVNGYTAMTGGQPIGAGMDIPAIVHSLVAEGVRRIVITTEDPGRYRDVALPAGVEVRGRDQLMTVQRELAEVPGVTVLLHDQACAAELRRERKRGRATAPAREVLINERVCEGCGDCGVKSGCLSVEPVETEFGRKTRINATSCNRDYTCLQGDCPSFVTVIAPAPAAGRAPSPAVNLAPSAAVNLAPSAAASRPPSPAANLAPPPAVNLAPSPAVTLAAAAVRLPQIKLPEPPVCALPDVRMRLVGIGGTGVVTVSQVIGMAALIDGLHASGLDQTGLSQKAGPVVSDLRLSTGPVVQGSSIPAGRLQVLLGFDILGAASAQNLTGADPQQTTAVISDSIVPTGHMVVDVNAPPANLAAARAAIDAATRTEDRVYLDAQLIAQRLLGDGTPANVIVLGAACQLGALPVSLSALEQAFRLNGVGVELNLAALAWGRAWIVDPGAVLAELETGKPMGSVHHGRIPQPQVEGENRQVRALVRRVTDTPGALERLLVVRVADLIGWGGQRAARRYIEALVTVRDAEARQLPGSTALTESVARGLHKLMAYKDEYEVARLHLAGLADLPPGAKVKFHLHPPLLRALGLRRKLALGSWFVSVFRLLARGRVLRGTRLDPFGYAEVRRIERELPDEYLALVGLALARLSPATLESALEVARLPELVRGYEQIKLAGVERFRARASELRRQLTAEPPETPAALGAGAENLQGIVMACDTLPGELTD